MEKKLDFANKNEEILYELGFEDMQEVLGNGRAASKKLKFKTQVRVLLFLYNQGEETLGENYPLLIEGKAKPLREKLLKCLRATNLLNTYIYSEKLTLETEVKKEFVMLRIISEKKDINITFSEGIQNHKKRSLKKEEENRAIENLSLKMLKKLLNL